MSECFYVYVDWTEESSPRPFYVGKGKLGRTRCLLRNKHHANIAKAFGICRKIVFETSNEQDAFNEERRLIQELKTFVHGGNGFWGANYTLGGEGTSGAKFVWSEERRYAASVSQKKSFLDVSRVTIHQEATRKQWLDENRRLLQSKRMIEKNPSRTHPDTAETKKRKSNGQKKRFQNDEERKRLSELTKASCQRPDVFAKRSKAQKARREREREKKQ